MNGTGGASGRERTPEVIVEALLTHGPRAWKALGVSARTLRRYRARPEVQALLAEARRHALATAVTRLGEIALEAVETLRAGLRAESQWVRIQSASIIVGASLRAANMDFEQRLEAMERALAEVTERPSTSTWPRTVA